MYCARHPNTETSLRCGKCDRPICPKCAVQTPVGARCTDCAKVSRLPVFQVSIKGYSKALGAGLGTAVVFGLIWGLIAPHLAGFGYLLALLAGYILGLLISRSVNRKRSTGLQVISGGSTLLCFGIAVAFGLHVSLFSLIALAAGVVLAAGQFR